MNHCYDKNPPVSSFRPALLPMLGFLLATSQGFAEEPPPEIVIIGVTPAQSSGLPKEKIPYNVQSANSDAIEGSQSLDLTGFLKHNLGSISLNDAQNNPLQPDVQFRGFTASPLLGLPQGLAVYQNGIRINEPLGDSVNWDLLPASSIYNINLIGGSNPLFGLNTLGGALSIQMKNGFNHQGHSLKAYGGSFSRKVISIESGNNNGSFAYYGNVHYFDEDGWRDLSPSDSVNFYGSLGWMNDSSSLNLNVQHGESDLYGNGPLPVELLGIDRETLFTGPDITRNNMYMISIDGTHSINDDISLAGNTFYRRNDTDSFNGDASNFSACNIGGVNRLLDGLEEDTLNVLGLEENDVCMNQITDGNSDGVVDANDLENFLNAMLAAGAVGFNIEDLTNTLSGSGIIAGDAINNISSRTQETYGLDIQATFVNELFERNNQFIAGFAYFKGQSGFKSRLELSGLDPVTKSTIGLGSGSFVDAEATNIETSTESYSFYFTDTFNINDRLSITLSGRYNSTDVVLSDQSGDRPELNGSHNFKRFNPAAGVTYEINSGINLYAGYSESSRAPTAIELSCNAGIFDLARANAVAAGEDPNNINFECRLPNAFLADPPLDQVVAKSFEIGVRGKVHEVDYHLGFFDTVNKDDIIFQSTGRSTGLFANVDETRRLGFESGFHGKWNRLDWFLNYSYIDATFQDDFQVLSPNHPFADSNGVTQVSKGDTIPGVPAHQLKLGGDYRLGESLSLGFDAIYNSGQYLRGDEANLLAATDGYALLNLRGRYRINAHLQFFASINNVLDTDYETFGILGENPSDVNVPAFAGFSNRRFLGPGSPRAIFAGIKLSL